MSPTLQLQLNTLYDQGMSVKKAVEEAMARPMSRKAFLGQVGALLLAVVGVSAALKSLGVKETHQSPAGSSPTLQGSGDYRNSAYGG